MGWAVRRADGTYRSWNAAAQDVALRAGEAWEERAADPEVTLEVKTDDETFAGAFDAARVLKACMAAILAAINDLRADPLSVKPAITPGVWRQRLLEAFRAGP